MSAPTSSKRSHAAYVSASLADDLADDVPGMPGAEVDAAGGEMDAGGEEMGMADEAAAIVTSALGELGKADEFIAAGCGCCDGDDFNRSSGGESNTSVAASVLASACSGTAHSRCRVFLRTTRNSPA